MKRYADIYMDAMLQSLPVTIFIIDEDGVIQHTLAHPSTKCPFAPDEAEGKQLAAILPEEAIMRFRTGQSRRLTEDEPHTFEYAWPHQNKIFYFTAFISNFQHSGHQYVAWINIDITERKQAEERAVQTVETAARQILKRRTAILQADRLHSLGEMAAGLVHEFSQPISGIRGFAEGLLLSKQRNWEVTEEELIDGLHQIVSLTGRMAKMIEHVRRFARDAHTPETMDVDLSDVIDSALLLMSTQFRNNRINLTVEEKMTAPILIKANPIEVEEALLALLQNARDAVEEWPSENKDVERNVKIRLYPCSLHRKNDNQGVALEVTDTGPGIPESIQSRVLEPFFTTKGPDRGTGLGLTTVRRTAEMCGGRFELESAPGTGTTARLRLPLLLSGTTQESAI